MIEEDGFEVRAPMTMGKKSRRGTEVSKDTRGRVALPKSLEDMYFRPSQITMRFIDEMTPKEIAKRTRKFRKCRWVRIHRHGMHDLQK